MATALVPATHDVEGIVLAAGGDIGNYSWHKGTLRIPNVPQSQLDEAVSTYDHAAYLVRRAKQEARDELSANDYRVARVLEDVLVLLQAKGALAESELPTQAQTLLARRRALRATLA